MIEAGSHWQTLARANFGESPSLRCSTLCAKGGRALTRQAALFENEEAAVTADLTISERVSRHAFATHMHSGSVELHVLQDPLDHAGIETTRI